jgi:hypothetical protein
MWPLVVIAGIIVAGAIAFIILSHLPVFRMTSRTMAQVVACEERGAPPALETVVTFRYMAGTRTLETVRTFPGRRGAVFTLGRQFPLYYCPATPTECRVVTPQLP